MGHWCKPLTDSSRSSHGECHVSMFSCTILDYIKCGTMQSSFIKILMHSYILVLQHRSYVCIHHAIRFWFDGIMIAINAISSHFITNEMYTLYLWGRHHHEVTSRTTSPSSHVWHLQTNIGNTRFYNNHTTKQYQYDAFITKHKKVHYGGLRLWCMGQPQAASSPLTQSQDSPFIHYAWQESCNRVTLIDIVPDAVTQMRRQFGPNKDDQNSNMIWVAGHRRPRDRWPTKNRQCWALVPGIGQVLVIHILSLTCLRFCTDQL